MGLSTIDEEKYFGQEIRSMSPLLYLVKERNPECVQELAALGKNTITECENFMERMRGSSEMPEFIDDRISLILETKKIPLFQTDPDLITRGNLPKPNDIAADLHLLQITLCNLYMGVSLYNSVKVRKDNPHGYVEYLLRRFSGIVEKYETSLRNKEGRYRNDPTGKAEFVYAYELLDSNIVEKVRKTGDYTILYGKEGIQLEVKDRRLFGKRRELSKAHLEGYSKGKICFAYPVHLLFLDIIPKFDSPEYA